MSEGTIRLDPERRRVLELEAKAAGLLAQQSMRVNVSAELSAKTLDELLAFGPSKYTLRATTLQRMEAASSAATNPEAAAKLEEDLS